jgi:hypothetical protein
MQYVVRCRCVGDNSDLLFHWIDLIRLAIFQLAGRSGERWLAQGREMPRRRSAFDKSVHLLIAVGDFPDYVPPSNDDFGYRRRRRHEPVRISSILLACPCGAEDSTIEYPAGVTQNNGQAIVEIPSGSTAGSVVERLWIPASKSELIRLALDSFLAGKEYRAICSEIMYFF